MINKGDILEAVASANVPAMPTTISTTTSTLLTEATTNRTDDLSSDPTTRPPELDHQIPITVIITMSLALVTICCVIGNSLVLLSVSLVHKLRTPSNYLILSLAVSDWLVGLLVMPLAIADQIFSSWPFGPFACTFWVTCDVTLCTASILNLMMISIDRYLVITRPFTYTQKRTGRLMALYIGIAWFLSLQISLLPLFVGWLPKRDGGICMVSQEIGYQIYATAGAFYLPMIVMIGLYGRIYVISKKLLESVPKNKPASSNNNHDKPRLSYSSEESSEMYPLNHAKRDSITTVPEHIVCVRSNQQLPLDHNLVEQTILEDGDKPNNVKKPENGSPSLNRLHPHQNHHNHNNSHHHHHHHHHLLGIHIPRTGSIRRLSVATIASVKKLMTSRSHKRNSHAIRTLGVIMGVFSACWLPFFILAVVAPICTCSIPKWVIGLLTWLGYVNSTVNPVIYARFNREFRTPYKEILCCRCKNINDVVRHSVYMDQYGTD